MRSVVGEVHHMQLAHEDESQPARSSRTGTVDRPIRILVLAAVLIVVALVAMSILIAKNLRESAIADAERDLARHSLTLEI